MRPHLLPLGLLVTALAVLFFEPLQSGSLNGSDVELCFLSQRAYAYGELAHGRLPLWNPYQFCGQPYIAGFQSAIFYPLNVVFLVLSPHKAFLISALLHLFLAGIAAYAFIWSLTRSREAAFIAALLAMLNGNVIARVFAGHATLYHSYPWVLFSLASFYFAMAAASWRWALLAGVGLAMQVLAGYPLSVLQSVIGMAVIALAFSIPFLRRLGLGVILLGLTGVVGVLLSAIQLVPSAVFTPFSGRGGGVSLEFAASNSLPPENLLTFFAPFFFGDMAGSAYWGRWYLWEMLPYAGLVPVVLFLAACYRPPTPAIRPWLVLGLAGVVLAFGKHNFFFEALYNYLPGFSHFRGPARALVLYAVALAFGSGLVWDTLSRGAEAATRQFCAVAFKTSLVIGVVLAALLGVLTYEEADSLFWRTLLSEALSWGDRHDMPAGIGTYAFVRQTFETATSALGWSVFWCAASGAGFWWAWKYGFSKSLRVFLILLIMGDLYWAGRRYIQPAPPNSTANFPPGLVKRIHELFPGPVPPRIGSRRDTADLSRGALDGIAHIGGYDPALPLRYIEYMNAHHRQPISAEMVIAEPLRPGALMRLTGIQAVVLPLGKPTYPGAKRIYKEEGYALDVLNEPAPRAFVVHRAQVISDKEARLKQLVRGDFDPWNEVILEQQPFPAPAPLPQGSKSDTAKIVTYGTEEVVVETELQSPGVLILTDTFYPEWKAVVDGQPAPILAADHLFRGIALPAGPHRVAFHLSRSIFQSAAIISLAALAAVGLLLTPALLRCWRAL